MSSFLVFLTLTTLAVQVWGQGFWAYDPFTGQAIQYPTHHTSGGLSSNKHSTTTTNAKRHHQSDFYNIFGGHNPNNFYNPSYFPPPILQPSAGCVPMQPPKIDWGECPGLEAKDEDKEMKKEKQKECIKILELNENSTLESLSQNLQDRVKECVLRKDELLNEAGKFNYDKAMEKVLEKGLPEELTKKVEEAHVECKVDASQKFLNSNKPLSEVEAYQDCMDLHLVMLCKIKVVKNTGPITSVNSFHGVPGDNGQTQPVVRATENHDFSNVMDRVQILSQALKR